MASFRRYTVQSMEALCRCVYRYLMKVFSNQLRFLIIIYTGKWLNYICNNCISDCLNALCPSRPRR